jgi:hypothetical protein
MHYTLGWLLRGIDLLESLLLVRHWSEMDRIRIAVTKCHLTPRLKGATLRWAV